ncbi:unnamed protein product [Aphanomyces euteiches]
MDGLQRFRQLKELSLSSNWIECPSFVALKGLTHLTVLNLSANRMTTTIGFPILPSLRELSIAYNSLNSLEGLLDPIKFPKLEILDLRDNEIADLAALSSLFYLENIQVLRLQNINKSQANPVCSTQGYPSRLLERMSTLKTLDGEDVDVLRELASLSMPKYTSVAKLFRPASAENRPPQPAPEWTALDARLRVLESQTQDAADTTSLLGDIDSKIQTATQNLHKMHKQTLQRSMLEDDDLDDDEIEVVSNTKLHSNGRSDASTVACQCDSVTTRETSTQSMDVLASSKAIQCDIADDFIPRIEAAEERARRAEAELVKLNLERSNTIKERETLTRELEALRLERDRFQQDSIAKNQEYKAAMEAQRKEWDGAKDLLLKSQSRVESLQSQLKEAHEKIKVSTTDPIHEHTILQSQATAMESTAALAKEQADAKIREQTQSSQEKLDEAAAQIRQLKRDAQQELKYSLEDSHAKYAINEKELSLLRHDGLVKSSEMDKLVFQHKEEIQRREKEFKQQTMLIDRQFKMTLHEMELEFRAKQTESILKIKQLHQAMHRVTNDCRQWEAKYEAARQREASLANRVQELTGKLSGVDKKLKQIESACQRSMHDRDTAIRDLEAQLDKAHAHAVDLEGELRESHERLAEMEEAAQKAKEVASTLQVKNIMLDDQAKQLMALRRDLEVERQRREDLENHLRDMEHALDESLARQADMEADARRIEASKDKLDQWDHLQEELENKIQALEYIEKEMQRMRRTIAKQEESATERAERMRHEHDDAIRALQDAMQVQQQQLKQSETKCATMEAKYQEAMDQNRILQRSVRDHATRVRTTENEMKVLLVQMEKERQAKRQHMTKISQLLQQLNHENA